MKIKGYFPLLLLSVIWAVYYIAAKKALAQLSVFLVGVCIRFITFCALTAIMGFNKELPLLFKVGGIWKRLLLIGTLGFSLDFTAFLGLSLSTASNGTVLLKSDILFANLITVIYLKERFKARDWVYSIVMLAGVLMVMDVNLLQFRFQGIGDLMFLVSALCVTVNAFVIKSVQLDGQNPAKDNVVAFYNNFITLLLFSLVLALTGGYQGAAKVIQPDGLLLPVMMAGAGQTLIYVFYYYNLRRLPVWIVKIFLLLMPVFAVIISYFTLGEVIMPVKLLGMVVVIAGAAGIITGQRDRQTVGAALQK